MAASRKNGTPPGKVGPGRPPVEHQFKPGNPGRPKGSRNKLSEDFFKALAADFSKHGKATVEKMREKNPSDYIRAVASLQSKEVTGEDGQPIVIAKVVCDSLSRD